MYPQSASRSQVAGSSLTSTIEADGSADAMLAAQVREAKQSRWFAPEKGTLSEFREWLDRSEARRELRCAIEWLKTLLQGSGEEAMVRSRVAQLASILDHVSLDSSDLRTLYGPIKRSLQGLCEGLDEDQRASTVAAACRELRLLFSSAHERRVMTRIGLAFDQAAAAVKNQSSRGERLQVAEKPAPRPVPRPRQSLLAGPKPVVDSPRAPVEKSLPKSDGVVLAQASMDIGTTEVRERHEQLAASFDRLISLMPRDTEDSVLKGLIAWRDSFSTPVTRFDANHIEMLGVGKEVLTLLCDVLTTLNPEQLGDASSCLASYMPNEHLHRVRVSYGRNVYNSPGSHVTKLVYALVDAESIRAGDDIRNPHRDERQRRFDAWVAPLLASSILTKKEVITAMRDLGLDSEVGIDQEGRSKMPPVFNIAAWRACLGISVDPADVAPLADVGKADLVLALDELRQQCKALDADAAAFDGCAGLLLKTLSRRQDDNDGTLQSGVASALRRINQKLAFGEKAEEKRELLNSTLVLIQRAKDPVAMLRKLAG